MEINSLASLHSKLHFHLIYQSHLSREVSQLWESFHDSQLLLVRPLPCTPIHTPSHNVKTPMISAPLLEVTLCEQPHAGESQASPLSLQ